MTSYTIAIDAMGGDAGPRVTIPAAINALKKYPELTLILVGDEHKLQRYLKSQKVKQSERLILHHASQVVAMDELPSQALRGKKDSSMRVAINLVKAGTAQACVSAGNTGALMATARFVLKTLPGIDRPAIISELPAINRTSRVLDLGANVDSCAEHIFQFAVMGSVLTSALDGIENPTIGLLNIGVEEIKGNDQVKRTAQLLAECEYLNYVGFVEGDDIYKGTVDVIVCDGFIGNVALKASEGIAKLIAYDIRAGFKSSLFSKICGGIAYPVLKKSLKRIDPARYNGASMVGLNGIVIKSHGGATVRAFENAIGEAVNEVTQNIPKLVGERVADLLEEGLITE